MESKKEFSKYNRLNTLVREKKSTASEPDYNKIISDKGRVDSNEDYDVVLKEVLEDEDLRSFISIITDAAIRCGYTLHSSNKRKIKEAENVLYQLRFRKTLKKIIPNLLMYLHSLVEIDKNSATGKAVKLYVVDTERISPKLNRKGLVEGWYWKDYTKTGAATDDVLLWKEDEIAHFEMDNYSPTFWGTTNIETLKDIIHLKKKVMQYMTNVFDQNLLKTHFHGVGISDNDLSNWLDMIYTGYREPTKPLVTIGDEQMEGKRYMTEEFVLPLIELLNLLRNKILALFRVPPIIAGTVDNSNRSNSEIQARFAFMNRIKAIQEEIAEDCEFELFPKIGLEGVSIRFGNIDAKEFRDYIDIAVLLMNAGAYKEPVAQWLYDKGYDMPEDIFPSKEEEKQAKENMMNMSNEKDPNETKIDKNSNLQSSRLPQDKFQK